MDGSDQEGSVRRRRIARIAQIAGSLAVVGFVLVNAPSWPDGPIKSVALWVREIAADVVAGNPVGGAEEIDQTTRAFEASIGATDGYFSYVAGLPEDGDFLGSPDDPVSSLVEYLNGNVEQLMDSRAGASSELAELRAVIDEVEKAGFEELSGVSLVQLRQHGRLVSDWGETFVESELAFTRCVLADLDRFSDEALVGEVVIAAGDSILRCADRNAMDEVAEDKLYLELRESSLFLVERWGPACLPSDIERDAESIADIVSQIDCSR